MNYLRRLIQKLSNRRDLSDRFTKGLPEGWTATKVEDSYVHSISSTLKDQWAEERRGKDKVHQLLSKNGFYNKCDGREGYIYYVEDDHVLELGYEVGVGARAPICFYPIDLRTWIIPKGKKINTEQQFKILQKARQWLKDQDMPSSIDLPAELVVTAQLCAWPDCGEQKIEGLPYCLHHSDLFLLRGQGLRGSILEE